MSNIVLDKDSFYRRIKRPYASWKEPEFSHDDSLQKVDFILTAVGVDEETIYSKSTSLTTGKKKVDFLKQIEKDGEEGIPSVKLLVREKNDKGKANFEKLLEANKESKDGKTLRVFSKENFPGEFCESWRAFIKDKSFDTVDISVKRVHHTLQGGLRCYHHQTVHVFNKYLKNHIMEIMDADKKVKHAKLSEGVEQSLTDKRSEDNSDSVTAAKKLLDNNRFSVLKGGAEPVTVTTRPPKKDIMPLFYVKGFPPGVREK
ncbi:FACT complex subunit spt16-like [Ochlerotatus camptorhynchus]|uniref:FACT complex subunit spt16-like n=1 Tax=Ochlerotatus camptorhynchus TaxID=644619 RepID=UPI0031CF704C